MPPESLLDQARRAMREERIEDAQAALINVIALEPESEEAWVLLAEAITDASKKRQCLERARAINPRNRAILRALESLEPVAPPAPLPQLEPAPVSVLESALSDSPSNSVAEVIATPIQLSREGVETAPEPVARLLEAAVAIAQSVQESNGPLDIRERGDELLRVLDRAAASDLAETRRWARATALDALLKLEQALTDAIANLPRDHPQMALLREQRHRALSYLR